MSYAIAHAPLPARSHAGSARTGGLNAWVLADALRFRPSGLVIDMDAAAFVPHDQQSWITAYLGASLRRISRHTDLLCVLTSRRADDAWRMIGIDGATYIGAGGEVWQQGELMRPGVRRTSSLLAQAAIEDRTSIFRRLADQRRLSGLAVVGDIQRDWSVFEFARVLAERDRARCATVAVGDAFSEDADVWLPVASETCALLESVAQTLDA